MEEEGVHSQQEDRGTEEEVDALFQKTQRNETGSNDRYDFYVPLAVRIENPKWDCLNPNMDPNTNEECAKQLEEVIMPAARVKKLMKMDPDVNIVAKQSVAIMSKATTLFIDYLASKVKERMDSEHGKQIHMSGIRLSLSVEYNANSSVQTNSKLALLAR
ncbi:hypothetical protein WA556_004435 [Blastocystis sp. ATCC 50177/Nand II]